MDEELVASLLQFGREQPEPPVLYPQTDAALLLDLPPSRRARVSAYRFVLADPELVDAARRQGALPGARRAPRPAGPARAPAGGRGRAAPARPRPRFPLVVKPLVRAGDWSSRSRAGARRCTSAARTTGPRSGRGWPARSRRSSCRSSCRAPRAAVESYHAYVDERGAIAGEFTGRKIRTFPRALRLQHRRRGRRAARRRGARPRGARALGLAGRRQGRLQARRARPPAPARGQPALQPLASPGAVAGVNLPALVHADLTGAPRPPGRRATRRRHVVQAAHRPARRPRDRHVAAALAALGARLRRGVAASRATIRCRSCAARCRPPVARRLPRSARRTALMRYGVIADVHANLHALDAALAFLSTQDVDGTCAPATSSATARARTRACAACWTWAAACVAGNHDLIALGRLSDERCIPLARASLRWTRGVLDEPCPRAPRRPAADGAAGELVLCHGSAGGSAAVRRGEQGRRSPGSGRRPARTSLIAGHTHRPMAVAARHGTLLRGAIGTVRLPPGEPVAAEPRGGGAVAQRGPERPRHGARHGRADGGVPRAAVRRGGLPRGAARARAAAGRVPPAALTLARRSIRGRSPRAPDAHGGGRARLSRAQTAVRAAAPASKACRRYHS